MRRPPIEPSLSLPEQKQAEARLQSVILEQSACFLPPSHRCDDCAGCAALLSRERSVAHTCPAQTCWDKYACYSDAHGSPRRCITGEPAARFSRGQESCLSNCVRSASVESPTLARHGHCAFVPARSVRSSILLTLAHRSIASLTRACSSCGESRRSVDKRGYERGSGQAWRCGWLGDGAVELPTA